MHLNSAILLLSASLASAHYTFPRITFPGGSSSSDYQHVKMTLNKFSRAPVQNVNSNDMRCYADPSGPAVTAAPVTAGSTVTFQVSDNIGHPGPLMFYLAKVPSGRTAANFDGSGSVWFKIWENRPTITSSSITWPSGQTSVGVTIPRCIPNGEYLLRVEHIGLHSAGSSGGAQLYIACAAINVSGGGSTNGNPTVSFPGAYSASHPGLLINIYWPIPTSYTNPGPRVFTC